MSDDQNPAIASEDAAKVENPENDVQQQPGSSKPPEQPELQNEDSVTMVEVLEEEKNLEEDANAVLGKLSIQESDQLSFDSCVNFQAAQTTRTVLITVEVTWNDSHSTPVWPVAQTFRRTKRPRISRKKPVFASLAATIVMKATSSWSCIPRETLDVTAAIRKLTTSASWPMTRALWTKRTSKWSRHRWGSYTRTWLKYFFLGTIKTLPECTALAAALIPILRTQLRTRWYSASSVKIGTMAAICLKAWRSCRSTRTTRKWCAFNATRNIVKSSLLTPDCQSWLLAKSPKATTALSPSILLTTP